MAGKKANRSTKSSFNSLKLCLDGLTSAGRNRIVVNISVNVDVYSKESEPSGEDDMPVYNDILEVINNTPLVKLNRLVSEGSADLFAKVEFLNPGGSVKDRMAKYVIEDAEKSGELKPGGVIVENTSGNTGVGVAMTAAVKGYQAIFTIPDKMSAEKINLLKAYGARVVVTRTDVPADSPESYYETAKRIHQETPGSFYVNQYHNPKNIEAHYKITGPEIWRDMDGKIDYFVAGIGTGGTLSGAGKYLKEQDANIKVIAVDPIGSVFYDFFKSGKPGKPELYKVEGIGEDMVVEAMDFSVVDDMIQVSDRDSFLMASELTTKEGLFAGGSSGTAVFAALKVAKEAGPGKRVVVVLPDSGTRYLSKIFSDEWMRDGGFLDEPGTDRTRVKYLLDRKGGSARVITAAPTETIRKVIERMKENGISQLPIVDQGKPIGWVKESDLLKLLLSGEYRPTQPISEAMELRLPVIAAETPIKEVADKMANGSGDAMLVVEDRKPVGIVTRIDLISYLTGGA
jgi:cystathionine beta-synthase